MRGRYRKATDVTGQVVTAAVVLTGLLGVAAIVAAFVLAALLVGS